MNPYVADLLKKIFVGLCIIITLVLAVKVYEYISRRFFNIEGFEDIKSIVTREYTNRYVNDSPIWSNKFYNMQFDNDIQKMQPPISFWKPDINAINGKNSKSFKLTGMAISNDINYKSPKVKTLVVDGDLKLPDDFKKVGEISGINGDIDWTNTKQFDILNTMQSAFNTVEDIDKFTSLYDNIYNNYESIKNLYQTYGDVLTNSMNSIVLSSLKFMGMQYKRYHDGPTQPTGTQNYFSMLELKSENEMKSTDKTSSSQGYVTMFIPFGVDVELYGEKDFNGFNYNIATPENPTERNAKFDEANLENDYKQLGDFVSAGGLSDSNADIKVCYPLPKKYDDFFSHTGLAAYKSAESAQSTTIYKSEKLNTHVAMVKGKTFTHCVTFDIKLSTLFENISGVPELNNLPEINELTKNIANLESMIGIYNLMSLQSLKATLNNIKTFITTKATVRYQHYYLLPALFKESKLNTKSFIAKASETLFENIKASITDELNNTSPLTYYTEKPFMFPIDYNTIGSDVLTKLITAANYTNNNNFNNSGTDIAYTANKTEIEDRESDMTLYKKIIKSIETNTLGLPPLTVYTPIAPENYKAIGDVVISKLSKNYNRNDELIKIRSDKEYMCVPEHCVVPVRPWRTTDLFYEINASTSGNQSNYLGFYMNPYTGTFKVSDSSGVLPSGSVEKVVACVKKCKVIDNLIRSNDCIAKTAKNNKILLNETPVIDTSGADAEAEYYEGKIAQQSEVIRDLKLRANNIRVDNDKYDIINKSENRAKLQNYVDTQKQNIDIITQKLLGSAGRVDVNVRIPADLRIKVTNSIVKLINDSPNMSKSQKQNLINQALNISDSNDLQQILNRCPTYDLDGYVKKSVVNDVCYGCELE